ncbi:MAG: RnfABCDGE type electron transport complex subunit D [Clostridiales bacterium]|nr:RnfABCDGE type electron transport complex subunit D [Clostridiales bacterium]
MSMLTVSSSPHIHSGASTEKVMRDVLIALAPAAVASVVIFGWRSLLVIFTCVVSAAFFEWGFEKVMGRTNTIGDLSACVTGVILAYNLPVTIPLWQAALGSAVAIVLVKQLFGGIGKNFANPAVTARIVLFLAFSGSMTNFVSPDGVTAATPLSLLSGSAATLGAPSTLDLFLGNHGGSLGEVSALALLIGFVYLLIRKVITWETPVIYIAVVFALSAAFGRNPVDSILAGGLMLGAIFMATDYVTAPMTFWGRVIFGAGAGVFTAIFRVYGSYPEGVSFAILLMNILTPYINRLTMTKPFGGVRT